MRDVNEPLLTIGAFARAVGLTASALRHYDECGLLRPAEVDDSTGYRYYTPDLARRAALVAGMREAGVPIETMRAVLDGDPDKAQRVLTDWVDDLAARSARAGTAAGEVLSALSRSTASPPVARATVAGPVLAAALRQVRAAADTEPSSPLTSVLLDLDGGRLDVVATNRFWMALRTLDVPGATGAGRAVLSRAAVPALAARLDAATDVVLELTGSGCTLDGEGLGTVDVAYPAHRIVLAGQDEPASRAVLDREQLVAAVEAVGRSQVVLRLGDVAEVEAQPVDGAVTGEPVELCLSSALLLRALGSALGPQVVLEASAPRRPVRVRSPYQAGFLALVMPIGRS